MLKLSIMNLSLEKAANLSLKLSIMNKSALRVMMTVPKRANFARFLIKC